MDHDEDAPPPLREVELMERQGLVSRSPGQLKVVKKPTIDNPLGVDKLSPKGSSTTEVVDDDEVPAENSNASGHLTSNIRTFINTIIAFLGSGVLGLPYAFRKTGIVLGLATLIFVAIVSTYAMTLVIQCKYKLHQRGIRVTTYGEIGYHAMGRFGSILVNIALVISQMGFSIAYLIYITTNVNATLHIPKPLILCIIFLPLLAVSMLRHMRQLAIVSFVADVMLFSGLIVVYITDFSIMRVNYHTIDIVGEFGQIPFFFGIASYCYEGVGMVLPLETAMKDPTQFQLILISTVIIITSVYATFGICGYLAFGNETMDVITLNMSHASASYLVPIVKLCLCVGLFCTYPMMLVPVFEIIEPIFIDRPIVLIRTSVVLLTGVFAVGIPNFGLFISFIGSTCCTMLAFILPSSFYLVLVANRERCGFHIVVLLGMILVGAFALVAGVADTLHHLLKK